ncbi:MAG: sulfur transferase domain-containing protein [Lysobacterales bacterium]
MSDVIANAQRPDPGTLCCGRMDASALAAAKAAGVEWVIDLLPETECAGFDEAAACAALQLGYARLPIAGAADLNRENVAAFDRLLADSPAPMVLVHCASGNRVGALYALRAGWLQGKSPLQALAVGRAHGLTKLEPVVAQLLQA